MPLYSSHYLQSFDIDCFAVFKQLYSCLVESQIYIEINYIDKFDFFIVYPIAYSETLSSQNIQSSFAATGIVSYNPDQIFSKLNIQFRTPISPGNQSSENSLKTSQNIIQLQQQTSSIKALLKQHSKSPPSPFNRAINQVLKICEITMYSAALLEDKAHKLRFSNEKQKQKYTCSHKRIPIEEEITVGELFEIIQSPAEAEKAPVLPAAPLAEMPILPVRPTRRRLPTCKKCGNEGHRSNHCPN